MTNYDIDKYCKNFIGYLGCYSADTVPDLSKSNEFSIINTDPSNKPGQHWVCLYYDSIIKYPIFYDSFGRSYKQLSPYWENKQWINSNMNREQSYLSNLCGHRCIAYAHIAKKYGINNVYKII